MLIIHSNGQTEPLQYHKDLTVRERVNGEHSLSFLLFANDEHYDLVIEESLVEYEGQQYRIKKIDERSKGEKSLKSVKAQHIFFNLIDAYQYDLIGGNYTITDLLNFALTGTDFSFTVEGLTDQKLVFNYGEANALKLVQQACELWGAEWELNNKHITVKAQIGRITDNQFRYKSNLKAIRKSVDTSKLATQIRGYGQGFHVDYTSPMSDVYGIRHAEPIRNDEISDQAVMTELLKRELNDQPNLSITVELAQLDFDVQKGDEIILIYEPLNIEMTARITELEYYPEQPKASKVTIANYNETFTDVMTLLAKNVEKIEKKNEINKSEIRQTNEQIGLEVERLDTEKASVASVDLLADEIELKVSETDYNGNEIASRINQTATTITIDASKINLNGSVTFSDLDTTTQNTINAKADSSSLGALAGLDVVDKARLGTTIIEGGYIRADLLLADRIVAGSLKTDTTINVGTDATIGSKLKLGSWGADGVRAIQFDGASTSIYTSGDGLAFQSIGGFVFESPTVFASNVDFSSANVTGLNVTARFG